MTIEKQFIQKFWAILLTLVALLVVDIGAILKARSANAEVTDTLESNRAARLSVTRSCRTFEPQ